MFDEGAVKVALELMDIGSLKDVVKLAKLDPTWVENSKMPLLPEEVASKIVQMEADCRCFPSPKLGRRSKYRLTEYVRC